MKDLIETLVAETQRAQCYRKRRTEFALDSASAADMGRFVASASSLGRLDSLIDGRNERE